MSDRMRYVECPRDAWQGFTGFIPTEEKVVFHQSLLAAGFRTLDLGSFVSPKAVPQLADTEAVVAALREEATDLGADLAPDAAPDFIFIVANARGLERAVAAGAEHVGYPLSVNSTFQERNTGRNLDESWALVRQLAEETAAQGVTLTVYLSMGFGNPYGESWEPQDTARAVSRLRTFGVKHIALADTVGAATPERVDEVLRLADEPAALGLHLHARPNTWQTPLEVALSHGVRWVEGALAGIGGCPFVLADLTDDLVGNLPTEQVIPFLEERGLATGVQLGALGALAERATGLSARYAQPRWAQGEA